MATKLVQLVRHRYLADASDFPSILALGEEDAVARPASSILSVAMADIEIPARRSHSSLVVPDDEKD